MNSPEAEATVTIKGPNDMYVLRLVDQRLREVGSSGAGKMEWKVPPGLYTARCEAGGPAATQTFRVAPGEKRIVDFSNEELPRYESAAPVSGAINNNEHHSSYAVTRMAGKPDLKLENGGVRLLVMNRRLANDPSITVTLEGFSIISADGARIADIGPVDGRFKGETLQQNLTYGRDAFLLDLPPGGYVLCWPEAPESSADRPGIPIWLSKGDAHHDWNTFVFVAVGEGQKVPSMDNVSIHLSEATNGKSSRAFGPGNRTDSKIGNLSSTATELALASIRTGRRQLNDEALWELLRDKFRNPMGGILGAYMLCERDQPDWHLFAEVINNLRRIIPDHPDIQGLIAVARSKGREEIPQCISFPPMLQAGAIAISELDWKIDDDLVKPGSIAEIAALRWIKGGPWTLFGVPEGPVGPPAPATSDADELKSWFHQNIPGSQEIYDTIVSQSGRLVSQGIKDLEKLPQDIPLRQLQRMGYSRRSAEKVLSGAMDLLKAAAPASPVSQAAASGKKSGKAAAGGDKDSSQLSAAEISKLVKTFVADQMDQIELPKVSMELNAWGNKEIKIFTQKITSAIPKLEVQFSIFKNAKTVGDLVNTVKSNLQQ